MTRTDPTTDNGDSGHYRFDGPATAIRRHVSLNAHFGHPISSSRSLDIVNRITPSVQTTRDYLFSIMNNQSSNGMNNYKLGGVIGYGSSATVYSALYVPRSVRVAIKMIDLDMFERNQIDELRRETSLMALSKHENVLPVYSSFVSGSKLCIVTPYLAGGSCLDIMKTAFPDGLDELSIATILKQALEGLGYLHKNGHIHRDVKAGNLLVDDDGCVVLSDFGVSSSLSERGVRRTFVGTPCWMAPEVMEQAGYDSKADIWSFGITAIELASGKAPFSKYPPLKVLLMTLSNDPPTLMRETTKHKYSKVFKDMVDVCLNKDPINRPTVEKLLSHPFFKQSRKKEYLIKAILVGLPTLERRSRKVIHRRQLSFTTVEEWDFNDDRDHQKKFDNNADTSVNKKDGNNLNKTANLINTTSCNNYCNTSTNGNVKGNRASNIHVVTTPLSDPYKHLTQNDPTLSPKQESRITFDDFVRGDDNYGNKTFIEKPSKRSSYGINYSVNDDCKENQNPFSNDSLKDTAELPSLLQGSRSNDMYSTYPLTKSASSDCTERKSRFKIHYGQDPIMVSPPSSYNSLLLSATAASLSNGNTESSNTSYSTATSDSLPTNMIIRARSSSTSTSSFPSKYSLTSQQHLIHEDKGTGDYPGSDSKRIGRFELRATSTNDLMPFESPNSRQASLDHQLSVSTAPSFSSSASSPILRKSDNNNSNNTPVAVSFSEPSRPDLRRQRAYSNGNHRQHLSDLSVAITPSTSPPPPQQSASPMGSGAYAHLQSHFEELIRNNNTQQRILHRIFDSLQLPRSGANDQPHFNGYSTTAQDDATLSMIESLDKQLHQIGNENDSLKSENEQLRKELDLLRLA